MDRQSTRKPDYCRLDDLCDQVNEATLAQSRQEYLDGPKHATFQIAEVMAGTITKSMRRLAKGQLPPHIYLCCCEDTFTSILTEEPAVLYNGYSASDDPLGERYTGDTCVPMEFVEGESNDNLKDLLENRYECELSCFGSLHEEDAKCRDHYYKVLLEYLQTLARFAKTIKSDSAYGFLEAIRLLSPAQERTAFGLSLAADDVKKAYGIAGEAYARLWADKAYGELKPLKASIRRG